MLLSEQNITIRCWSHRVQPGDQRWGSRPWTWTSPSNSPFSFYSVCPILCATTQNNILKVTNLKMCPNKQTNKQTSRSSLRRAAFHTIFLCGCLHKQPVKLTIIIIIIIINRIIIIVLLTYKHLNNILTHLRNVSSSRSNVASWKLHLWQMYSTFFRTLLNLLDYVRKNVEYICFVFWRIY